MPVTIQKPTLHQDPAEIIRFTGVCKRFGDQSVLQDLNFEIYPGETVVLMGPSGCGKSTVLRCLNKLEAVDAGDIEVRGFNITRAPRRTNWNQYRANIGMVFQQFNLFPHMTVLDNITIGPVKVKGVDKAAARQQAMALLERVGLVEKADRYPITLSGGEKQRVSIARALAMSSDILLMDEPTSALDPVMTAEVLRTIQTLSQEGITLLIVTHEVDFALRVADRILFFDQGQIAVEGPPDVFTQPLNHPMARQYFELLRAGKPVPDQSELVQKHQPEAV
ncbi:MAG: amino acid ABC transporter ATP-binding protein [Vampirovibrionales bacterium]